MYKDALMEEEVAKRQSISSYKGFAAQVEGARRKRQETKRINLQFICNAS